jgi:hypothetical protein
MSQSLVRRLGLFPLLSALLGASTVWGGDAPVWQRVTAEGESYQAIILRAEELPGSVAPMVHAIVVDTSASQIGEHRQHALEVTKALLEQLPNNHNVKLFALDVTAEPLSDRFAGPRDGVTRQALATLEQRVPLGATNLVAGLQQVLEQLPAETPASIVLIGDGQSAAEPLTVEAVSQLAQSCRVQKTSITSYGVGAQTQPQNLGVLAVQTGGCLLFDAQANTKDFAQNQGRKLAAAATGAVLYPDRLTVQPATISLLPATPLPLRLDRETIYLSHGVLPANASLVLTTTGRTPQVLRWRLSEPREEATAAFLPGYTQRAAADGGLSNGLAGLGIAALANDDFQVLLTRRLQDGVVALENRQPETAARIAEEVRQLDDSLAEARQLTAAAEQLQVRLASRRSQLADNEETPANENLIDAHERAIRVRTQRLQLEVARGINASRAAADPELAIDELKRLKSSIRSALDISPEDRARMEKQLDGELLAATTRQSQLRQVRDRRQQALAQREAQERLAEQMMLDEERLHNLIDRVRALMSAGRHGDDAAFGEAQAVAEVAINIRPGEGTSTSARFAAESAEQLTRAFRQRALRANMFLETLFQVEESHVPFPDEPPVVFPSASEWQALTERRKQWRSVDLRRPSPIEARIEAALEERTELAFADTPLIDAIDFLRDYHQINIWIDETALQDEGVDPSTPITLELSGIRLRSALRLMLKGQGLTYVIEDEVMKITTQDAADGVLSTRVYDVADFQPIINMGGMGGGMMGGMGGGMMGGGMGGMGGGMMGGGMGGMGGGGMMGGGFPSVPAEPVPNHVDAPKKKAR